jgi:4'-phosphopantetheinyl transferase
MKHHVDIWLAPIPMPPTLALPAQWAVSRHTLAHRQQRLAADVLRRRALSHTVSHVVAPEQWRFVLGYAGKPSVVVSNDLPRVFFSCAHVEDAVCVATSRTCTLGVDLERMDQQVNLCPEVFLSPMERAQWTTAGNARHDVSFIRLWTLKEAYAKMTGHGFNLDPCNIGFTLDPLQMTDSPWGAFHAESVCLGHLDLTYRQRPYCLSLVAQCEPSDTVTCAHHVLDEQWNLHDSDHE